jgi:tRNA A-37 threonylcarbamoyl transferase component Bud32
VLEELDRGGMGVVYKARQLGLNRVVAVKQMLPGTNASPEQRARFKTEAEAIARLQHPHILQVFQADEHQGQPFVVLEYVPGGSLDQRTRGRPQPPRDAARLVLLLARAVHAAHQAGVVHRDLKPANVLLAPPADEPALNTPWGCPKVSDFGLARLADSGSAQTVSGVVMGTPAYMAPEQAEGRSREIGPATDVWALGVILYELLTGQRPFQGESPTVTLHKVCAEEPRSVCGLRPEAPPALEAIVRRCLRKRPLERYPSAAALAEDLQRWLEGAPVTAAARRPVTRRFWRLVGVGVAAALVVVLGLGLWGRLSRPPGPASVPPGERPAFKGWIDILVSEPDNPRRQLLRLHEPRARPLKVGDEVRVEAVLTTGPGYLYVVWIDARGKVIPIYPWEDFDWNKRPALEKPVSKLLLPLDGGIYPIEPSPPGLETLLLLVRDEPLPPEESNLAERLGELGSQAWPDLGYGAWFENGKVVLDEPNRAPGKVGEPNNPAERTQLRVRQRLGKLFAYCRAVAFGNSGVPKK